MDNREIIQRSIDYIEKNLQTEITATELAEQAGFSLFHYYRIFQQATGSSLWDYVVIKRLMAARAMIQRGEPAHDACTACGFSDYSAFYRAYRKQYGTSPREDSPGKGL